MGSEHQHPQPEVEEAAASEEAVSSDAAERTPPVAGVHEVVDEATSEDDVELSPEDVAELVARAEKADEYLALAQRTQADFENFRKRAAREAALAQDRGVAKLAKQLLPALDNLTRALQAAEVPAEHGNGEEHHLTSGIRLVHDELVAALGRAGIEAFSPWGERFDPTFHEAMLQQPVEGAESGTVVEVYQPGYRLGDVVLRPARVVVAA